MNNIGVGQIHAIAARSYQLRGWKDRATFRSHKMATREYGEHFH
jgi:hypothetical protein